MNPFPWSRCILLVVTAALTASAFSQATPAQAPVDSSSYVATLDSEMRAIVERQDTAGVVLIAAGRHGIIYEGAFGLAETATGRAMTKDAIFQTASMTKAVTATALMQFVEAGAVSLNDPAEKFLPEFADLKVVESFDSVSRSGHVAP
jgi:CubicO group peptidase (beta-lactamase class C family)